VWKILCLSQGFLASFMASLPVTKDPNSCFEQALFMKGCIINYVVVVVVREVEKTEEGRSSRGGDK
jgi:hypothetical protein